LIDRIQEGDHHSAQEVANLRLLTSFAKEIRPLIFIPQNLIDTFCGFTSRASERNRKEIAADRALASQPSQKGPPRALTDTEINRMDSALWDDG
jgi:hypothetical protein